MKVYIFIGFVFFIYFSECECAKAIRRITNGIIPKEDKPWVVYLLQTKRAKTNYDAWICGGSLVTNKHIITSAACIEDVKSIFAIAGYKKYVTTKTIFEDECTKRVRNKIIKSCVPKYFDLVYNNFTKWVTLDIAVAFVEKPYNFKDSDFTKYCSYAPQVIGINSDKNNEFGGALIYGWGHEKVYRKPSQKKDLNVKEMHYTPVAIVNKSTCIDAYSGSPGMEDVIPRFMICSSGRGGVNSAGNRIALPCRRSDKNCIRLSKQKTVLKKRNRKSRRKTPIGIAISSKHKKNATFYPRNITRTTINTMSCTNTTSTQKPTTKLKVGNILRSKTVNLNNTNPQGLDTSKSQQLKQKRRSLKNISTVSRKITKDLKNSQKNISTVPQNTSLNHSVYYRRQGSQDYGPCQNDHGGPITSFIGRYEVLLGVQSAFVLDSNYACRAPYVYTSTASVRDFIDCIIFKGTANEKATIDCDNPIKLGFEYDWHFDKDETKQTS